MSVWGRPYLVRGIIPPERVIKPFIRGIEAAEPLIHDYAEEFFDFRRKEEV